MLNKLFKTIDDKFNEIGFQKIQDNEYVVVYERKNEKYGYTQVIGILHKANGRHIVLSYDKELFDDRGIGNTAVGLTFYEMRLIMKKMRQKKWKSK